MVENPHFSQPGTELFSKNHLATCSHYDPLSKDYNDSSPSKYWSGRADLNGRPPAPKAGALTRLRYAPTEEIITGTL